MSEENRICSVFQQLHDYADENNIPHIHDYDEEGNLISITKIKLGEPIE